MAWKRHVRDVLGGNFDMAPSNSPQRFLPDIDVAVEEVLRQELTSIHRKENRATDVTDRGQVAHPNLGFIGAPVEFDRSERKYRLQLEIQASTVVLFRDS
jgi:hypothetical protein